MYMPARRASPQAVDIAMAGSCDLLIVTVEKIVPFEQLRRYPDEIEILPYRVAGVVEAPYGAHPCAMTGAYAADDAHLKAYVEAAKDKESFGAYLKTYVSGAADHMEYLERIGVRQLMAIRDLEVMA